MKIKKIAIGIVTASALLMSASNAPEELSPRDGEIVEFSKNLLKKFENEVFSLKEAKVVSKTSVPEAPGFTAYVVEFTLMVSDGKNTRLKKITDTFFASSEGLISPQLFNMKGEDIKEKLKMDINKNVFYTKEKLLFGDGSSDRKMLVFSDPFCVFCREAFSKIEEKARMDKMDVYMSHFPIETIHPSSKIVSAILIQAKRKGIDDLVSKIYKVTIENKLATASDIDEIIDEVDKATKYKASKEELISIDIPLLEKDIDEASKLGVSGTPTIFVDGVKQKAI